MRKLIGIILAVLMLFSMIGCTTAPSAQEDAPTTNSKQTATAEKTATDEEKVIRVACESWHVTKVFLEHAAESFEANHPGVKVELQTYADQTVISNYAINWAAGETPVDMVIIDGTEFVQQFLAKDLVYDWENELNLYNYINEDAFVPSAVEAGRINGTLYCLPIMQEIDVININKKMFKEAGLVDENGEVLIPKTWEEFHEYAQKMTVVDENGVVQQQGAVIQWNDDLPATVMGTLCALNGSLVKEDGITIDFDNENFRNTLEIWKEGVKDGSFSIDTFADTEAGRNGFKAGTVGMLIESSGRWVEGGNEFGMENVTVAPLPGNYDSTYGYINGIFMPKCAENVELCLQFITEEILGEYCQMNEMEQYGKLPSITEYYEKATDTRWLNILDSFTNAQAQPKYKDAGKLNDEMRSIVQEALISDEPASVATKALQDLVDGLDK